MGLNGLSTAEGMGMPAKLLAIGFDALEATLVDRWADEGLLPTFAELRARGVELALDNDVKMFPDTVWPEIQTGRHSAALGWYWRPMQLHEGEGVLRRNEADDFDLTAVWDHASAAGKRVAVFDVPYALPRDDLNGVLVRELGTHGPAYGPGSFPEGLLEELEARHGEYPMPHRFTETTRGYTGCDTQDGSREALLPLPERIRTAIRVKEAMYRDLLGREDWDLFLGTFCESHCAGHQLWHFFDPSSPWHDPDAPPELANGFRDAYVQLDRSLGAVIAAAGEDATVLVFTSHGMGPHIGGWQLLPEILVRLGYGTAAPAVRSIRSRLPRPAREAIKAVLPDRLRARLKDTMGISAQPFELAQTRAAAVMNGMNGAIRINVRGRDPHGSVEPGEEYEAICDELAAALSELRDKETGESVVTKVVKTNDAYSREDRHPNLPDLVVRFREDRPIVSVTSPRIGTVTEPARDREFPRSGDHTAVSRAWLVDPRVESGATGRARLIDLAPTMLAILGVPVPEQLDGRPLELATAAEPTPSF
jgi:predicted AlkP superfamily phosphohydrolase/phosphomutase